MAGEGPEARVFQHAGSDLRAHPAVERVSGVGLGNRRQRRGAQLPEEIRFRNGAERAYPSDDAEGGGESDVSHGGINGVSAATTRQGRLAGADEGSGRRVAWAL